MHNCFKIDPRPAEEVILTNLAGPEKARYVQEMFTRIAGRYDFMNRTMTGFQDVRWRREVIQRAMLPAGGCLLDLGAGTGDLAREALRQVSDAAVVAADFTLEMMRVGRERHTLPSSGLRLEDQERLRWCAADGRWLPFSGSTFDAVVSGFLLRNVTDVPQCLAEQYRVIRPGGRIVTLDTSPPPSNLLAPFIRFHLHTVIPTLGSILAGQAEAYHYLPDSTEGFLEPEQLASRLMQAGFREVGFRRLMFGTIAIHWGRKPAV
jgi:demethylmenaquinone methyltransferase / 2-methoxy-6-polyprenyl-1,4-benzoquinol methylase